MRSVCSRWAASPPPGSAYDRTQPHGERFPPKHTEVARRDDLRAIFSATEDGVMCNAPLSTDIIVLEQADSAFTASSR